MKRMVSVLVGILMITMMMPAFAGGPADGIDLSPKITLVRVIKNTQWIWVESPLPYAADGHQVSSGMNVRPKLSYEGAGILPKDTAVRYYAVTNGKAKCNPVSSTQNIYNIYGEGRIYFHADITAESVRFHRTALAEALSAKTHPSVSLATKLYDNGCSYTVEINCFTKEITQAQVRAYHMGQGIYVEVATKYGYITKGIGPVAENLTFMSGSTKCDWRSGDLCESFSPPDKIAGMGLYIDLMPTFSQDDFYIISMKFNK